MTAKIAWIQNDGLKHGTFKLECSAGNFCIN